MHSSTGKCLVQALQYKVVLGSVPTNSESFVVRSSTGMYWGLPCASFVKLCSTK